MTFLQIAALTFPFILLACLLTYGICFEIDLRLHRRLMETRAPLPSRFVRTAAGSHEDFEQRAREAVDNLRWFSSPEHAAAMRPLGTLRLYLHMKLRHKIDIFELGSYASILAAAKQDNLKNAYASASALAQPRAERQEGQP